MADIKKFHNQVHLVEKDIHMQRFLWRGMKENIPPHVYSMIVNTFGVKPANCIATSALHKSADKFSNIYPVESRELKEQTYIDDALIAAADMEEAKLKTARLDEICEHASMENKGWTFSGDSSSSALSIGGEVDRCEDKVLGLLWDPKSDSFHFRVELRLDSKEDPVKCVEDVDKFPADGITRRTMLSNVAKLFDPCGWWCPVLLEAKLLMRESWCGDVVGWDDPLPEDQALRWRIFLKSLLNLKKTRFERSLWPEEKVKGLPMLVVFTDGSMLAYGGAAYIRWELEDGGYWSRLIMAKSKIAPKNRLSIPRMELNGAVLGNRLKNFLIKETNFQFSKVYHLVDSSTVLGYVHKECGTFGPYQGIRIADLI